MSLGGTAPAVARFSRASAATWLSTPAVPLAQPTRLQPEPDEARRYHGYPFRPVNVTPISSYFAGVLWHHGLINDIMFDISFSD
jgi:hypothetical protein